ncbi:MAG: hypothetical protein FJX72_19045, partial [Armatimonadetes bacterium]|nr:hypothetical protein [Armatimonadota bacterium]
MMRSAFTMAFVIAVAGVSVAQPGSAPIAKHDFEGSDHGWQAMGATGRVSITGVAANVKSGKGTLKFEYLVGPGEMSALMLPVSDAPPKGLKSIRFWVKSPVSMPLFVVLQERGGGRYQAQVAVPADRWQRVELSLSDFALSKEKDDPADPNNKLDVDQLEAVAK